MIAYASRLSFSLDLLIGEAKQRMRRRRLLILVMAILIGGGGTAAALVLGQSARAGNPFAIRFGMTAREVRNVAGRPYRTYTVRLGEYARIHARDLTHGRVVRAEQCWSYHATQKNTNLLGIDACFSRGHVLNVLHDVHL